MIVRKLVEASGDSGQSRLVESRARHCQLIASRMKLDPVVSHRLALAAWLSGLEGKDAIVQQISKEHDLDDVLLSGSDSEESTRSEGLILGVVRCYELLKQKSPEIAADPEQTKKCLKEALPSGRENKRIARILVEVLEAELFLSGGAPSAGRILIIDPEEAVSPVLSPPLTSDGYQVKVVGAVDAAREIFGEFKPHLVMADMNMPVTSGIDFCKEVRLNEDTAGVPFLMLTSSRGRKTEATCLKAGADEVLIRPIDLEMLFIKLGRLLTIPEAEKAEAVEGVSGSLTDMGFVDIIQIVTAGDKSLEIVLEKDGERGVVWIRDGEIIHAEMGEEKAESAFYKLMSWTEGMFSTKNRSEFGEQTIQTPVMGLLMEGARLQDEAG